MISIDQLNYIEYSLIKRILPFYLSNKVAYTLIITFLISFSLLSLSSLIVGNIWPFLLAIMIVIVMFIVSYIFLSLLIFDIPSMDKLKNISSLYEEIKEIENYKLAQVKFLMKYESYKNDEFFDKYDSNDKILSEVERFFDEELNKFKSKFPLTKKICGINLRKPLEFKDKYELQLV